MGQILWQKNPEAVNEFPLHCMDFFLKKKTKKTKKNKKEKERKRNTHF